MLHSYDIIALTKKSIAENFRAFAGNQSRVIPVQDQCSNHLAKESTLWRSCQRLIIY